MQPVNISKKIYHFTCHMVVLCNCHQQHCLSSSHKQMPLQYRPVKTVIVLHYIQNIHPSIYVAWEDFQARAK
jgi:hypothetical protein